MQAQGRRALVLVEDDPDIRDALAELLQEEGFAVATASNGSTVLIVTATRGASPLGADGLLKKPFDIEELLGAVERYCPFR